MEQRPFVRDLGLALGEATWQPPAARLPVSEVDLHLEAGRQLEPWERFARLLGRIERAAQATGRQHPTPVEQDTVTGCLRQLLPWLATTHPEDDRVRAAFRPAIEGGAAVRRALDAAWVAVLS